MIDSLPAFAPRRPSRAAARAFACLLGVLAGLLPLAFPALAPAEPDTPYIESAPPTGWHLFTRPSRKNPADQWAYVQELVQSDSLRKATRQATALRLFWPDSPEAPQAQLLAARLLDRRGYPRDAFDAYQLLLENYPESCDYMAICGDQLRLANNIYTSRLATCWGLFPGFSAPERSIPLYQNLLTNAPEGPSAPEAAFRIGLAHQANYHYPEAIDAFFQVINRFPESSFAADAALEQARCHIALADDAPFDARARDAAIAACDFVLSSRAAEIRRAPVETARRRLLDLREAAAYERCLYYDKTLKDSAAALLEYKMFAALYPASDHLPAVQERIARLQPQADASAPTP
ncbi:MAG: tetratricopeptide repeat protein [Kiritimatiellae bacterium]|nr:tetratricopeptide repeat protein [Kiritimatiellia bacterium]